MQDGSGREEFVGHFVAGATEDGRPTASYGEEWRSDLLKKEAVPEILSQKARESKEWREKFAGEVNDHGVVALHVYVTPDEEGRSHVDLFDCACRTWTKGGGGSNVPS